MLLRSPTMLSPITSDRFKILRKIGEGGMGEVYEALDAERGEHVAVKVLRNATAEAITRFKREFRALQGLHHPNLVTTIGQKHRHFRRVLAHSRQFRRVVEAVDQDLQNGG